MATAKMSKKETLLRTRLNTREIQVAFLISRGKENSEIGEELGIHKTTVAIYVHQILEKLLFRNRVEVAVLVATSGLKKPSFKKPKKKR